MRVKTLIEAQNVEKDLFYLFFVIVDNNNDELFRYTYSYGFSLKVTEMISRVIRKHGVKCMRELIDNALTMRVANNSYSWRDELPDIVSTFLNR